MLTTCRRTTPQPARSEAMRLRCASHWLAIAAACCVALCGCRTFGGRRGAISQSVADCRQLTDQGISSMERGDWKRAETLLSRAVEASPVDVEARRQYAEVLSHRGATQEALAQLEEARKQSATDPALCVRAGEVYLTLNNIQRAAAMADEALALDPKLASAWTLRGRVAAAAGSPRQALADYHRALGYAPDNRQIELLVAESYRQLNEPERALAALQSLAEGYSRGDEPQQVLYLQGLAQRALGRYDEAAQSLAQAVERDRASPEILYQLAEVEWQSGNLAGAQATVQQALAMDPNHPGSRALSERMASAPHPGGPRTR
jgi:tetratricopeptide (TPR) repeat protein